MKQEEREKKEKERWQRRFDWPAPSAASFFHSLLLLSSFLPEDKGREGKEGTKEGR